MRNPHRYARLNQHGKVGIKTLIAMVTLALLLLGGWIAFSAYSEQTWTGSGTVMKREKIEARTARVASSSMAGPGIAANPMEGATPESYKITIRDRKGKDHTFSVTKMQYDATRLGDRYIKNG